MESANCAILALYRRLFIASSSYSTAFSYSHYNLYEFGQLLDEYAKKPQKDPPSDTETHKSQEPFLLSVYQCIVLALNESKNISTLQRSNQQITENSAAQREQMTKQLKNMFVGCILQWMQLERSLSAGHFNNVCFL